MSDETKRIVIYQTMVNKMSTIIKNDDIKESIINLPTVAQIEKICMIVDQFVNLSKLYLKEVENDEH